MRIEVDLFFECKCGNSLTAVQPTDTLLLTIEPCRRCLDVNYNEAYDEGYEDGRGELC